MTYERSTTVTGDGIRRGQWKTGLCGYFTHLVPNCLMVTFCPCVSIAQIASRLGVLSYAVTLCVYLVITCALWTMSCLVSYNGYNVYHSDDDGFKVHDSWVNWDDSDEDDSVESTIFSVVWLVAVIVIFAFVWQLRAKTRERFEIPSNCCGDCCATFWCTCYSMAQVATHIKSYKPGSCDFGPPDTLPAYPNAQHYIRAG